MADKDQAVGSLGITQRWKEFVTGFHARLFGAMLYTPNGDSMANDTADAVKAILSANSGIDIGDVDVLSIAAGDNNIGNVDLASAIPAGSAIIGKVGIDQTTPGDTSNVTVRMSAGGFGEVRLQADQQTDGINGSSGGVLPVKSYLWNGSTSDQVRNNHEVTALTSAARTASVDSADLTNYNARGAVVVIDVTAIVDTPSITVTLQGKSTLGSDYYTILASAAIVATGQTVLRVYPGLTAVANSVVNDVVPRLWRVSVAAGDADSITYSVSANYIL